jgi:predicted nucleic acid-binding protein
LAIDAAASSRFSIGSANIRVKAIAPQFQSRFFSDWANFRIAIAFRKNYKLRLPDAIIVATAKSLNAILFTNDLKIASLTEIATQSVQIL